MFLLLSISLTLVFIYLLHIIRQASKPTLPPGPRPLPLIGNLHQLAAAASSGDLHIYLRRLSKKFESPIIHMKLGSIPLIVVSSAKLAKQVLKTQDLAFCSRPKSLVLQKFSFNNTDIAFSPYNDRWREVRKIASIHLLSHRKVQSFRPIREDEVSCVIAKISKQAAVNQVVNLSDLAAALGRSLMCRIASGKKYDENELEMRRFEKLLEEGQAIAIGFFMSDYFPALGWVDKLSGLTRKVDDIVKKMDLFYEELIEEHLDPNRVRSVDEEDDILDVLIHLKQHHKSSSIHFTWDNVKALLTDIFVAGTDTSSAVIVWTMTALIKAPYVMKKLQHEIRILIGKKGKVDEDDLPKLPYLKAVVNETLRFYPTAPLLIPRESMQKCNLDGYEIEPKTIVYVNAYAIGRDPEFWENPDEFMPERFLNSNIDVKGQDFGFIPFGSGRRMCPGISMGIANVELTVANLLYSFDWELQPGIRAEDVDTDASPGLVVQKKNPLMLLPKKYCV